MRSYFCTILVLFFFSLCAQETTVENLQDPGIDETKQYSRLSVESHYVYITNEFAREQLTEYPDIGMRYRFSKRGIVYFGAGVNLFYSTYKDTPSIFHQYDIKYYHIKPHLYLELELWNRIRPWFAVGDNIRKAKLVELDVPMQTGDVTITTHQSGSDLTHNLNITHGLAIDLIRKLFVQFQFETTYVRNNRTKISTFDSDSAVRAGLGFRF